MDLGKEQRRGSLAACAGRRRLRLAGDLGGAKITGGGQRLRLEGDESEMDGGWLGGRDEEETRWAGSWIGRDPEEGSGGGR